MSKLLTFLIRVGGPGVRWILYSCKHNLETPKIAHLVLTKHDTTYPEQASPNSLVDLSENTYQSVSSTCPRLFHNDDQHNKEVSLHILALGHIQSLPKLKYLQL